MQMPGDSFTKKVPLNRRNGTATAGNRESQEPNEAERSTRF
jgi:hypothetical protein